MQVRISLSPRVFCEIMTYTDIIEAEWSAMGLVEERVVNEFLELHVPKIYFLKQYGSTGGIKIDETEMGELTKLLYTQNKENQLRFWVHSHGNLSVFWSHIDERNIARYDPNDEDGSYLVSTVVNRRGEQKSRVDVFGKFQTTREIEVSVENRVTVCKHSLVGTSENLKEIQAACIANAERLWQPATGSMRIDNEHEVDVTEKIKDMRKNGGEHARTARYAERVQQHAKTDAKPGEQQRIFYPWQGSDGFELLG